MHELLTLISPRLRYTGIELAVPQPVTLPRGIIAVIGENASGKSVLACIIENGWNFMTNYLSWPGERRPRVHTLAFCNLHSLTGQHVEYYQQRFESTMNDDVPTVSDLLASVNASTGWDVLVQQLGLTAYLDKKTNYLSSGELRRLLIALAMADLPDILVLDNPYIGLDAQAREVVEETIDRIAASGTSVMMLVCDPADLHPHSAAVVPIKDMTVCQPLIPDTSMSVADIGASLDGMFGYTYNVDALQTLISDLPCAPTTDDTPVVEMHDCRVCYGHRTILDHVDWTVRRGECWSLSGRNGSGKSTLLSLINADNPQAYSNDIRLFGKRRGTGESIWDIKGRIGFLSAERHLYFRGYNDTVYDILARAVKSDPSDFGRLDHRQQRLVDGWLDVFGMRAICDRRFRDLSFGRQRLVLLMAALVRMPELLILDEPLHGLDLGVKRAVLEIVERLAERGITLVYVSHIPSELPRCISCSRRL